MHLFKHGDKTQQKPSKFFSITKKPYKKVYRVLGIKWTRRNRFGEMLDLVRQNQNYIDVFMRKTQQDFESVRKQLIEYQENIKRINVKPAVKKTDLLDTYKEKFNKDGYSVARIDNKIRIWNNDLIIEGVADNTLWTADAVLCLDEYHFDIDEKYVMFDIGLNLGITSLHKARDKNCVKIYGYEPFEPTFKLAQNNMDLNPKLSGKISIFDFGLGDTDKEMDINYNPDRPGAMSSVKNRFPECGKTEKIKIKRASSVLAPLFKKHKQKIFLKIDCEGAEKEILPDLDNAGLLNKADVIVMEWHFENPKWIIDLLKKNGFVVFCVSDVPNEIGMIRAYRRG